MRIIQTADLTPQTPLTTLERELIYNGLDCCVTHEVLGVLLQQLDPISQKTYDFSRALQAPILDMSMRGVRVDLNKRAAVLADIRIKIDQIAANLTRLVTEGIGVEINWRSNTQLKSLFYDVMGLAPIRKRNSNGQFTPTVNRDAIERLQQYYYAEPICVHLLALRDLDKKRQFLETELDSDGRIRCNFNIAGTNTGRLASSFSDFGTGTNLQNVDRELRSIFVADEGYKFCNVDLEQGDSRNVGAILWNQFIEPSGDNYAGAYLDACESGDLHTTVAKLVWPDMGWTGDKINDRKIADATFYRQDSFRQTSKKLGHATNFYGQAPHIAKQTRVPTDLVADFQRGYFQAFPAIGVFDKSDHITDTWHSRTRIQLRQYGFITTLLGRRRFFFGRSSDDETIRGAIAFEPQSLTADEIDTGLLRLWRADRVQLLLQVHDSILFQFPEEQEDEIIPWALNLMKVTIPLKRGRDFYVPVEAKTGWNWGEYDESKNPDGIKKWQGADPRKRQDQISTLSIQRLVG